MANFIRYSTIFKMYELVQPLLKYSLPVETELPGKTALVLAPHPDDESIGCGATLGLHAANGGSVEIVWCTSDGEPRDSEAAAAAKVLNASFTVNLKYPVESLQSQSGLPDKLAALFDKRKPDMVFIPFALDNHVDHRGLNAALVSLAKKRSFPFMIYAYPVWFPLHPNVLIDAASRWQIKEQAIKCYASQLATRDYIRMSNSLASYWAEVKGRKLDKVETFFRATFGEYAALAKKILK